MYDRIVGIAEKRVVVADDFAIGESNWLLIDHDDIPREDREARFGEGIRMRHSGVITRFEIRRIFSGAGKVEILVYFPSHPGGIVMHLDADELALRIEAS